MFLVQTLCIGVPSGGYDPQIHDFGDIMKIGFMTTDILLLDEKVQVHGVTILLDFTEFSASHVWYWTPDTVKKAMRCWQVCVHALQVWKNYIQCFCFKLQIT